MTSASTSERLRDSRFEETCTCTAISCLLVHRANAPIWDRRNKDRGRQAEPAGTMPRNREPNGKKGHVRVRIEPFQLERWMTKYEVQVKWDIAESGIYPMSFREILDLLPHEARETELDRLLDL